MERSSEEKKKKKKVGFERFVEYKKCVVDNEYQ